MAELDDRYRSLFVIGRGGMGTVEVALERSPGGFERIVALKRMLPETSRDERHKAMFLREAHLAARLSHPNVVHAFAFGELHGELYLAMEYVEGEPLARLLSVAQSKEGGLDPSVAAHVLAEVCDGLHAAHELCDENGQPLRVVHRDVSPHNVMVSYEGHVKLLDFGVAKFDSGDARTRTGEVKGKMGYMSPEQALGEPLDRRSDLFSIGALLYECVTGAKMWGEGTDLDIMRRLALDAPPRLDGHPNARPELVDLHARLVAREPSARPATAQNVADELRAFLATSTDARVVKGMMRRLFADEAANQRTALSRALEEAAPANIDELRRSIEPPSATDVPLALASSAVAPPRSRRGLIVVAGVASVLAVAAVAASAMTRTEHTAAATTSTQPAPSAAPSPSLTPTPTPTPTPTLTPAPTLAPAPAPASARTPARAQAVSPPTPPKPKPASSPPHVDPSPF